MTLAISMRQIIARFLSIYFKMSIDACRLCSRHIFIRPLLKISSDGVRYTRPDRSRYAPLQHHLRPTRYDDCRLVGHQAELVREQSVIQDS
jgi:hypothetical protein